MTDEQSIRDDRLRVELSNDIAGIVFDQIKRVWPDLHPLLDLRYGIADAVIASPMIRRIQAEAWDAGRGAGAENFARNIWEDGEPLTNPYREDQS